MSERNAAREIPKREFAELFGISEKQIERYCQAGMPHRKDGRAVLIKMPEGRVWYHKHLEAKGEARSQPTKRSDAVDRRAVAEAALAEISLAKARNELMTVEEFDRLLAEAFGRVRARLSNLPPRLAGAMLGAATIQEAQARAEPLIREVMEELRRADDVPGQRDDEAAA